MATEKKKPSWEEIVERKMNMARERGSRVLKINSPLGSALFNVLQQFDQAYARFKGQLGEAGGVSHEEGAELMEEAQQITMALSDLTARLSKKQQRWLLEGRTFSGQKKNNEISLPKSRCSLF